MTTLTRTPPPYVLGAADLPTPEADAVLDEALATPADVGIVEVAGGGAVTCLQGLFTNDVERCGTNGFVYGAVLTPKGMIETDAWAARDGTRFHLVIPRDGLPQLLDVFQRSLPPRLARFTDRSDTLSAIRLVGPAAVTRARAAGIEVPEAGRSLSAIVGEAACTVSRPGDGAAPPFELQLLVPAAEADGVLERLAAAGVTRGRGDALELARVLRGWPRLGAEIASRTLPQEVRFDENHGVSYTKGCYTGQETVARIHFRGHPNRCLVGLVWDEAPELDRSDVVLDGKPRGSVTSLVWLGPVERFVGLAIVRREIAGAELVTACGATAAIRSLPFAIDE